MSQDFDLKTVADQMAEIPGGKVVLRDNRIKRVWTVHLKPFLLARYPVTQHLYFGVTHQSPSTFSGDRKPVETVSWRDAVIFCNLLSNKAGLDLCYSLRGDSDEVTFDPAASGYRLPTEAEWGICL